MALLLRKACEPILSDVDLDAYHADIHPHTKHLCLYTPCGQQFAVVNGVLFSRLNPTNAEIEYACDLLKTWCIRNEKTIEEYIDAFSVLQRMEAPADQFWTQNQEALIEVSRHPHSHFNPVTRQREHNFEVKNVTIKFNNATVTLNDKLHIISIVFDSKDGEVPLPTLPLKFDIPKRILAEVNARIENMNLYYGAKAKVDNTQQELNTCSN